MLPAAFQASTTSSSALSAPPVTPLGTILTWSAKFGIGSPPAVSAVSDLSAERRNNRPSPVTAPAGPANAAAAAMAAIRRRAVTLLSLPGGATLLRTVGLATLSLAAV